MTDSPPNPEDGELWIPSDVFHEIISSNISPQKDSHISPFNDKSTNVAMANNITVHLVHRPKKSSLPKAKPKPKSQTQMQPYYYCGFPSPTVQPNGNRIPSVYHTNASFQQLTRPVHIYNPIFQPTTQSQVARVQGTTVNFAPNYGGTGVFLPPSATVQKCNHFQEKTTQKAATGIFPNHHPQIIAPHKKKNSGKNNHWNPKRTTTKKDTMEQKGEIKCSRIGHIEDIEQ
ncbi:hypothetical protein L484_012600 [Morus notabilis]|uniref:Uncharacterized protein n=1 Tax=Morus notabilis TaxID=981085 RepID=W9R7A9_9ROSA|nr:hypothetical protein L484_012600 [Morus notabilis]